MLPQVEALTTKQERRDHQRSMRATNGFRKVAGVVGPQALQDIYVGLKFAADSTPDGASMADGVYAELNAVERRAFRRMARILGHFGRDGVAMAFDRYKSTLSPGADIIPTVVDAIPTVSEPIATVSEPISTESPSYDSVEEPRELV